MNWYFYWYYTIYNIYKRYSWDNHFDIFATSMFSFFIANLVFSIIAYLSIFFDFIEFIKQSSLTVVIPCSSVFIINYFIFLPKQKQLNDYEKYKEVYSNTRSIISILLCIFSIAQLYIGIILFRNHVN
jgi:hypothetical protein